MLRISLWLVVCLVAPPVLASGPSVTLGIDVAAPNVSAGTSPVPSAEAGTAGMSPVPEPRATAAGTSPAPEPGAVASPPPPAPPALPTFRPDGSVLRTLVGTLKVSLPGHGTATGHVALEFRGDRDGAFEKVSVAGDGVNLLYNESFIGALLDALEDLASDALGADVGVGLLGIPTAKVKSVEAFTKIRVRGDVEIDTGTRVLEGKFAFKATEPTAL